ncbi:uncharacterized protein LOC122507948 [Leptopilina heterotoma]|uniref:uncharacterized protein LOC122507948 n=1 Tax=Leptopilina heterotoma TaxID=63436 RepID=UPI001CA7BDA4|nr:uncharacterized protein LOC122507948 [Leptopilina heterotoma]
MKYLLYFAGVVLFQMINTAYGDKQIMLACANELGIPTDMLKNGLKANMGKPEFRCFYACVFKKDGILEPGNTINTAVLKTKASEHVGPNIDQVVQAGVDCGAQYKDTADECDFFNNVVTCFISKVPDIRKMLKP